MQRCQLARKAVHAEGANLEKAREMREGAEAAALFGADGRGRRMLAVAASSPSSAA